MDDLEKKFLKDYGQYLETPVRGFADGGFTSQIPDPNANIEAWNNRANAGVRKDIAYRPGVAVTYKDGKWHQTVPQTTQQPIYSGSGRVRTIVGYKTVDVPTSGRGGKAPYDVQYTYDPREYTWDKFGNKIGRLPTGFGGGITSYGLSFPFKENALGTTMAIKYAEGGEVKGYADGGLTDLEQQVQKDYGQYRYKAVDLPAKYKLAGTLPAGVTLEGRQLRVDPSSSLYGTKGDMLAALQNAISPAKKSGIGIGGIGMGGLSGYRGMGGYQNANGFGGMGSLGFGSRKPAPVQNVAKEIQVTRTPDEALQEYLRRSQGAGYNMTLDDLKNQIQAKRMAMANIANAAPQFSNVAPAVINATPSAGRPTSLEELKARYYAPAPTFAHGGYVHGYARGTEDGPFNEDTAPTITPYEMPDIAVAQPIVDEVAPRPAPPVMAPPPLVVAQPDFTPITSGQVEPTGGGATPTVSPAVLSVNPELKALLDQYSTGADYSADLKQARTDRQAREKDFNATLDKLMTGADEGPSKAEMYFKLAAAFGTPSKTGAFGEGLAQAAGAMAEHKKEERTTGTAKRKMLAEIALKKQELALESAKDQEKTLLGLQSEANKDRREFIKAQVKEFIDSGKPQSNAGKIAKDKGFVPGTKEYQDEVDKQVNLEIEKQMGVINAQLLAGKVALSNLAISTQKAEREAVKLEPDERKAIRDDEDAIHAGKTTIKNLDEALQYADTAFTSTAADQAAYKKLRQTNPTDPRVVATEQLDNLLGVNVLGSLKTTFGGNPTEGERAALKELQGFGSASPVARKQIIARARKALEEAVDYRSARITKIESGGYRKKTQAETEGKK